MKSIALSDFLTDVQIAEAVRLFNKFGTACAPQIRSQVITPNMAAINEKLRSVQGDEGYSLAGQILGKENDALYLAYAVVHALSQTDKESRP